MTSPSNSSHSTRPIGRVLWGELLVLSRFHSSLRADEWNFCPLIYNQIFDAGAPSTLVGPLPGNWLAARIADLTPDLQVLLSWGSTVASFHSLQYSLSVSSMSAWVSLTPVYITCCYNSTNFGLCSKISNKILILKVFDLQWRSWSELHCVPSCLNPNFRNIKHSSMQILWRQKLLLLCPPKS